MKKIYIVNTITEKSSPTELTTAAYDSDTKAINAMRDIIKNRELKGNMWKYQADYGNRFQTYSDPKYPNYKVTIKISECEIN